MMKYPIFCNHMRIFLFGFLLLVCLPGWTIAQVQDQTPPTVTSTTPANGESDVTTSRFITAIFSEPMDSSTITASTFTVSDINSNSLEGTVSYNDTTNTAIFTPSVVMALATTYTATITTGARDIAGNNMASDYSWSFSTIEPDPPEPLVSLKTVPVPLPPNLDEFVKDRTAAIQLGKALFWDMQVGSDGVQACASCHFHAGADNRAKNQLAPGFDTIFDGITGPNYTLTTVDFPRAKVNNDITGSQGIFNTRFNGILLSQAEDDGTLLGDTIFNENGAQTRRVTGRNSPSAINAIFNFRNFWDGRANNVFNGVDPFGPRNANAKIHVVAGLFKSGVGQIVRMVNASAASQAVSPPNNSTEMAYDGRTFPDIARKLFHLTPLGKQAVDQDDSVLGSLANPVGTGLNTTYQKMILNAFHPKYWRSARLKDGYTLMENNFSLFWGISIMLYESTLVSDDSPFDKYMDGDLNAMTQQQKNGMVIFQNKARCIGCHSGAEFTNAAVPTALEGQREFFMERMLTADRTLSPALYDTGFYNTGVRQTNEDLGVGGNDPFGNPLNYSRQYIKMLLGLPVPDQFQINPCFFVAPFLPFEFPGGFNAIDCDGDGFIDTGLPTDPNEIQNLRVAVDGAFKVPSLRNVELTGPYFHNGGRATLRQVVEFYDDGADFRNENLALIPPDILPRLNLTEQEIVDLVAFMLALTDDRVRYQRAPFDHPQLFIPNGHPEPVTSDGTGKATDDLLEIPGVGRNGGAAIQPFLNLSHF